MYVYDAATLLSEPPLGGEEEEELYEDTDLLSKLTSGGEICEEMYCDPASIVDVDTWEVSILEIMWHMAVQTLEGAGIIGPQTL